MMKKLLLFAVLMLTFAGVNAQEKKGGDVNEKAFEAKVREMVYRLRLTDEQKAKFVPVYRRYNEEMRAAWGPKTERKAEETNVTRIKRNMERQQRVQAVQLKYVDDFAKVLTDEQVDRFFKVEKKIQQKFHRRGDKARENHGFNGRGHKRDFKGRGRGNGPRGHGHAPQEQQTAE